MIGLIKNLKRNMEKIANIDFDNTICEWAWPDMGEPKEGAKEALQELRDMGYYIRIFSCRTSHEVFKNPIDRQEQVRKMEAYLDEYKLPYDEVLNINKPLGIIIDDSAIGYKNNWEEVIKELKRMRNE